MLQFTALNLVKMFNLVYHVVKVLNSLFYGEGDLRELVQGFNTE